jgi:hypothetical protein
LNTCHFLSIQTKLKKQFNVNWKAAAVAHDKSIEKVSSADKIIFIN